MNSTTDVRRPTYGSEPQLAIQLELEHETGAPVIGEEEIRVIALSLMRERGLEGEWGLEVRFVTNATIRALNAQAQGIDEPTDVLSFPVHFATNEADPTTIIPANGPKLLGSLVIAPAVAAAQAPRFNRTADEELCFLIDHGLRHLLGSDHDDRGQWLPRSADTAFQPRIDVISD